MKHVKHLLIIYTFICIDAQAQQSINGKVFDSQTNEPLTSVLVRSLSNNQFTYTNDSGYFSLLITDSLPVKIVFSFVGYKSDTLVLDGLQKLYLVSLHPLTTLKEVVVQDKTASTQISKLSTINMQTLTTKELAKAACCNLSESFETNATVDVNFTDASTGAKQIQMLGLDGVYTQILSENFTAIRGLTNGLGLALVPGPLLQSIQITKGVGSVVNGYESLSGVINLEYQKPETAPHFFVNLYQNHQGRSELNLLKKVLINQKFSWLGFAHYSNVYRKNDFNSDGFLDQPLSNQINVFNRFKYQTKRIIWQVGLKAITDKKQGGQYNDSNALPVGLFKINNRILQYEAFSKFALLFPETPYRGLGLITNYRVNSYQISNFHKNYFGNERYAYIQLIYQDIILNTNHTYKTGISYINNMLSEYFIGNPYNRIESVPGIFFEYTYNGKRISVISGVRYDKHNLMGDMITPRLHIKYELPYNWQARLIVGTGQRLANIFTENPSVVASARKVYFNQYIQPEKAVNSGVCLLKSYSIADNNGTLSVDYFYTYFFKQSVADLEQGVQTVYIKSVNNKGQAHAAQVEVNQEITKNFDFRLAYKWYNVLSEYGNVINTRPFIPSNRALINVAYSSLFDIWKFDITAKYFSSSRLPSTQQNPPFYQRSLSSPDYYIFNFQVTKAFKKYDVYVGCENVLNYMQPNPIVASDNPFSVYYDASMIWGPVMGRIIYAGLRLSIK